MKLFGYKLLKISEYNKHIQECLNSIETLRTNYDEVVRENVRLKEIEKKYNTLTDRDSSGRFVKKEV